MTRIRARAKYFAQPTFGVAPQAHHRMNDQVRRQSTPVERHAHGIDEKRHIVGDNLNDRVGRLPTVLLELWVVHVNLGDAGLALLGVGQMGHRRAIEIYIIAIT